MLRGVKQARAKPNQAQEMIAKELDKLLQYEIKRGELEPMEGHPKKSRRHEASRKVRRRTTPVARSTRL